MSENYPIVPSHPFKSSEFSAHDLHFDMIDSIITSISDLNNDTSHLDADQKQILFTFLKQGD